MYNEYIYEISSYTENISLKQQQRINDLDLKWNCMLFFNGEGGGGYCCGQYGGGGGGGGGRGFKT